MRVINKEMYKEYPANGYSHHAEYQAFAHICTMPVV